MTHLLQMIWVGTFTSLYARGSAAARDNVSEAASGAGPGRRSSITFTGVDCIYGSGDWCLEGCGVLPAFLLEVMFCYGSLMVFSII